jgi:hypothetical protein
MVFCALPHMERCAERDQEDAPVGQAHLLSICRKVRSSLPLKHLEQLIDPAGLNFAVRCHFIDHAWQQA